MESIILCDLIEASLCNYTPSTRRGPNFSFNILHNSLRIIDDQHIYRIGVVNGHVMVTGLVRDSH